ncbi:MAG: hypothetical protein AB1295_00590 [Candidatus Micrarchaeota archaeon]
MKSLHRKAEPSRSEPARPETPRNSFPSLKQGILTCALAASMAFGMPLAERTARADPPAARPATAKKLYTVKGISTTISDGAKSHDVYILAKNLKPLIEVEGPARLTLEVFPVLNKERFDNGVKSLQRGIVCSSGPAGGAQTTSHYFGGTGMSSIKHADVDSTKFVIGTPIRFTADVTGKGAQQFRLISPHGFLQIVSVMPLELPKPVPRPKPRRIMIDSEGPKADAPKPKPEPKAAHHSPLPVFSLGAERFHLKEFGPGKNEGDANITEVLGHIPLRHSISLLVGAYVTTYGIVLKSPGAESSFRSLSTDLMAGIGYHKGKNSLELAGIGGYRHLWAKLSTTDGRSLSSPVSRGEYGGMAKYAYDPYFSAMVLGTSNQFNPLVVKLRGSLPWGWVKGRKPSAEVLLNWLRAAVPDNEPGMLGGMELGHDEFEIIAVADIPLFRLKMFTLSAIAGGEVLFSSHGEAHGSGLFGGALYVDHKGISMRLSGMANLEGVPYLMLNMEYRR